MGLRFPSSRIVISKDRAWEIIRPLKEDLAEAFQYGWSSYWSLTQAHPELLTTFEARTRASIVHDFTVRELYKRFDKREADGIRLRTESNTLYLVLQDVLAVRLKKLGKDGKPQNSKTDRQYKWDRQALHFPEMGFEATNAAAGYQLNSAQTSIEKILVSCTNDHRREWAFVLYETNDGTMPFSFRESLPDAPELPKKSIVTPKIRSNKVEGQEE